ncbi:MAG: glycosyltransferase [Myxococcota bacterium]
MLVTNGLRYGGAERVVEALAEDMQSMGHTVAVVATTRGGPIGENLQRRGIPVHVLGLASAVDGRAPFRLWRHIRRFRPDIVHSHLAVSDIATAVAGPRQRVCTVHNPGVELSAPKRRLWHLALRRFRAVVAVSEAVQITLPIPARVIRPSLVDAERTFVDQQEARRRLGLPLDQSLVLGIGRLSRVKGFDVLAAAAPQIRAHIAVMGEGDERTQLAPRLHLLGAREDAADLLPAADVVVIPSRSEGFPQVPLQAMAAGRPVVATRVGGTPEIVLNEQTGLLVPPEDPVALAAAINRVLDASDQAIRWGQTGRQRLIQAQFTRAAMVSRTVSLYREVTGK